MSDENQQDDAPEPTKDPETIVYCKLPNGGATIITTFTHCQDVLGGTVVGKPPPPDTKLVACKLPNNGPTVETTQADCTGVLNGVVTISD